MVKTFYDQESMQDEYIVNDYNTHRFDEDNILVTVETGAWVVLDEEEYDLLRLGKVEEDQGLFKKLKEKGVILTEDNVDEVAKEYRKSKKQLTQGPSLHIITPTLRCNAKCVYCHSRAKPEAEEEFDMDRETAEKTVDFIMEGPNDSIVIEFQGGELTLNWDITEHIIDYAKEKADEKGKNVQFSLVTNLTLMNEDIIQSLKEREIMGISTSLDGPKEVHDQNRPYFGGGGTHDDVVHWIKRIKNEFEKDFNLNALTTVTKPALDHGPEIVDEFTDLGFTGIWLRPLNNIGYAADTWDQIGYSMEEFYKFWNDTLDYILQKNRQGVEFTELMSMVFIKKILQAEDPMMVDIMSPCGAGISQLLYKYNGDIHTCDEGKINDDFKLGNVEESDWSDIIGNETVISMMDASSMEGYLSKNSPWEPYVGVCPIYTLESQGTIISKLPEDDKWNLYTDITRELFRRIIFNEDDREIFFDWYKSDRVFD